MEDEHERERGEAAVKIPILRAIAAGSLLSAQTMMDSLELARVALFVVAYDRDAEGEDVPACMCGTMIAGEGSQREHVGILRGLVAMLDPNDLVAPTPIERAPGLEPGAMTLGDALFRGDEVTP